MEPSALLLAIITAFLLINSASSQVPPPEDLPFPLQVVPSNQIPPGFKQFSADPPGMSLVLEDPNLPGIQQVTLHQHLPPGFTLVIPNEAEYYGFNTKLVPHPPECAADKINNIKPGSGLRAVPPAPPGQLLVFRSPFLEKGMVNAHPPPGYTATFPINPPQGMTYQPEYVAPYVPPPFQVIPNNSPVPMGMREVVNLLPNHIRVLSDPSKPNILKMIPKLPETFKLIAPQTGPITASNVRNVLHPDGFTAADKWNIPPGMIPLPLPGWGEKLVLTDTNNPGVKTIIAPPQPGVRLALSRPSPPNIKWTVMKQKDLDQISQAVAAPAPAASYWDGASILKAALAGLPAPVAPPPPPPPAPAPVAAYSDGASILRAALGNYEPVAAPVAPPPPAPAPVASYSDGASILKAALGNYDQGGYQPEAAGVVDNIGQDYQSTYDNSISNANELANPVYVDEPQPQQYETGEEDGLVDEYPTNDNDESLAYPTEERIMEVIKKKDKMKRRSKSAENNGNKIFKNGILGGGDNQKVKIFLTCILYVILI